jgi:hypothetical protein
MSEDKKELSQEEYTERKEKLNEFYTKEIEYLETQLQYETLLRDISKARAERLQADAYILQMTNTGDSEDVSE